MAKKKRRKNKYTRLDSPVVSSEKLQDKEQDSYDISDGLEGQNTDAQFFDADNYNYPDENADYEKSGADDHDVLKGHREVRMVSVDDYSDRKTTDAPADIHIDSAERVESNSREHEQSDMDETVSDKVNEGKSLVDKFLEDEERAEAMERAEAEAEEKAEAKEGRSLVDIFLDEDADLNGLDDANQDADEDIEQLEQEMEQVFDEFTRELPVDEIESGLMNQAEDDKPHNDAADETSEKADFEPEYTEAQVVEVEPDKPVEYGYESELEQLVEYGRSAFDDGNRAEHYEYETEDAHYRQDYEIDWPSDYESEGDNRIEPDIERESADGMQDRTKKSKKSERAQKADRDKKSDKSNKKQSHKESKQSKKHSNRHNSDNADKKPSIGTRLGIVGVTAASVIISMIAGCGMAMYDMNLSVADITGLIAGNSKMAVKAETFEDGQVDDGLTFIEADEDFGHSFADDVEGDGLTFIDAEDDGLTFIDADDDGLTFIDAADAGDETATETAQSGAGMSDDNSETEGDDANSVTITSEISGIASVKVAGSDEEIAVATLAQTLITDPNVNYPLEFTAVGEDYFNDALFIGDSRLQGFGMWAGLPGTYYCATGFQLSQYKTFKVVQTGNGKIPIFQALPYNAFSKIYIKVGINELGGSEEAFEAIYAQMIAELRAMEPRAIIYIHAILPVTEGRSATDRTHNNTNIIARNESLKKFALEQKAYYIDVGPAVSDETGCLRPESASDGIHMSAKYMGPWKQYLLDHAIVVQ